MNWRELLRRYVSLPGKNLELDMALDNETVELRRYIAQLEFVLKWWLEQEKISDIDIMHTIDLRILSELATNALKESPL